MSFKYLAQEQPDCGKLGLSDLSFFKELEMSHLTAWCWLSWMPLKPFLTWALDCNRKEEDTVMNQEDKQGYPPLIVGWPPHDSHPLWESNVSRVSVDWIIWNASWEVKHLTSICSPAQFSALLLHLMGVACQNR